MKRSSNKKLDINNLMATLSAIVMFVMMIVLIVYYVACKRTTLVTVILFTIFGLSILGFIVFTILFFNGTPRLKNK